MKQMTPAKIAPLAVCLLSDAAQDVTGQIFAVRKNEIFLMSQTRPVRSVHRGEGWTPETVAEHAHAGAEGALLRAGPLERRVQLGPGLRRCERTRHSRRP